MTIRYRHVYHFIGEIVYGQRGKPDVEKTFREGAGGLQRIGAAYTTSLCGAHTASGLSRWPRQRYGSSIGTSIVSWVGPPHFFQTGRIIVLYVGNNQEVIELLGKVVGPQMAGR